MAIHNIRIFCRFCGIARIFLRILLLKNILRGFYYFYFFIDCFVNPCGFPRNDGREGIKSLLGGIVALLRHYINERVKRGVIAILLRDSAEYVFFAWNRPKFVIAKHFEEMLWQSIY